MARLEAFTVRKYVTSQGEEKSAWTKLGVAFPHSNGTGYSVQLDAIPAPTTGKDGQMRYEIVLRPPMEKDDKQPRGNGGPSRASTPDLDDAIPFARCDLIP